MRINPETNILGSIDIESVFIRTPGDYMPTENQDRVTKSKQPKMNPQLRDGFGTGEEGESELDDGVILKVHR